MFFTTVMDFTWGKVITRPGATRGATKTRGVGVRGDESELSRVLQVLHVRRRNPQRPAGRGGSPAVPRPPGGAPHRDFLLHVPLADVYHRPLPPACHARQIVLGASRRSSRCFRTWWPARSSATRPLAEQLRERQHTASRFASGVAIFIVGFAKKILLAQSLRASRRRRVQLAASLRVGRLGWGFWPTRSRSTSISAVYSDMAVGLGRMLGFEFPKNFDAPYRSESVTELWRRWHISLSSGPPRLPLHRAGRQPQGRTAHLFQSRRRHAPGWAMALGKVEFSGLGRLPRRAPGRRTVARQTELLRGPATARSRRSQPSS